jgi:hypothetical protein
MWNCISPIVYTHHVFISSPYDIIVISKVRYLANTSTLSILTKRFEIWWTTSMIFCSTKGGTVRIDTNGYPYFSSLLEPLYPPVISDPKGSPEPGRPYKYGFNGLIGKTYLLKVQIT